MFHPHLGPLARLAIALAVFVPSLSAAAATLIGLRAAGWPDLAAGFPAGMVAIAGIIGITYGIETRLNRREDATDGA